MKKERIFLPLFLLSVLAIFSNPITLQSQEAIWTSRFDVHNEKTAFLNMSITPEGKLAVIGKSVHDNDTAPFVSFLNPDGVFESPEFTDGRIKRFNSDEYTHDYAAYDLKGNIYLARRGGSLVSRYSLMGIPKTETYIENNISFETSVKIKGMKTDPNGNLVIIGDDIIMKYDSVGRIDMNFGDNGVVNIGGNISAFCIDNQGAVYISTQGSKKYSYLIKKYTIKGLIDSTFGENGEVMDWFDKDNLQGDYGNIVTHLRTNNNGDILALGWYDLGRETYRTVLTSYSKYGIKNYSKIIHTLSLQHNGGKSTAISINKQGEIAISIITEIRIHSYSESLLYRLSSNGEIIDTTQLPFILNRADNRIVKKLIYNDDGTVLVGGTTDVKGGDVITLIRISKNGLFDNQFGKNGIVYISWRKEYVEPKLHDISIDNKNNIHILHNQKILKIKNAGIVDSSFNFDGVLSVPYVKNENSIEVNSTGKVTLGGDCQFWDRYYVALVNISSNGFANRVNKYLKDYKLGNTITDLQINKENDIFVLVKKSSRYEIAKYSSSNKRIFEKEFGKTQGVTTSIILDNDGKILISGQSNSKLIVFRHNSDGSIDHTFNSTGHSSNFEINGGYTIKSDSENRILVSGVYNSNIALTRFNYNGSIDSTFGNNGILQTLLVSNNTTKKNFVIDEFGRIIVIGAKLNDSNYDMTLVRYLPDGKMDLTFGEEGIISNDAGMDTFGKLIELNNDGKIIAVGTGVKTYIDDESFPKGYIVIKKYDNSTPVVSEELLDNTFGTEGIVKTKIGEKDYSFDSVIDPNGNLVSVGTTITGENPDFAVVRYKKDGTLDNSFGNQGKVTTPFGSEDDHARSVIIDGNGKIVVAGFTQVPGDIVDQFDFAVARYEPNGTLDASFGSEGKVITSLGPDYDFGSSVVLDNTDKLIVVGLTEQSGKFDLGLIRYNSDGTLDESFGENGKTITELNLPLKLTNNPATGTDKMAVMNNGMPWIEITPDVVIDNNSRIIAAATAFVDSKLVCSVSRYDSEGRIDLSFGNNGVVTTSIGSGADYSAEVLIDIQGKILLLANTENDCSYGFALVRYNENGSLDGSYGENGISDFGWDCSRNSGKDAVIDSLGRVLVAVNGNDGENESILTLYRVTENGYVDDTFDSDGIVESLFDGTILYPESINLEPEGKIVIAGVSSDEDNNTEFLSVRYKGTTPPLVQDTTTVIVPPDPGSGNDGDLDISYGNNGFAETSIVKYDYCYGSAIDSESRIILVGLSGGVTDGFPVMRYSPSGRLDNSFGTNGIVRVEGLDVAYDVDIDSKGRIIAVGKTDNANTSGYDITVVRYLVDGTLDQSFGQNGIVLKNISYNDGATSVSIDKDDKIIITGYSHSQSQNINDDIVVRFNTDGTVDESFGVTGIVTIPAEGSYLLNRADVVIDNFDRIIIRTRTYSLYRLKDDGSFDTSFGTNGFINTQPSVYSNTTSIDLSVDLEGKIVVLSNGSDGESYGAFLQRYNVDGSLDDNFGVNGITDVAWGDHLYLGKDLVIDSKGRILVTATYKGEGEDVSILRYVDCGWTDDEFNDDGIVETTLSEANENPVFIGIDPIGNILISGTKKYENGERNFFVAKYFGSTKVGEPGANVGGKDFAMNQNYPNPFNPTTTIRFKIPFDNNVTLKVYNMIGQEVATLVNENKSAGLYKVTFDATNLPSGIYIYRLDAGSFTEVHKMLLLK